MSGQRLTDRIAQRLDGRGPTPRARLFARLGVPDPFAAETSPAAEPSSSARWRILARASRLTSGVDVPVRPGLLSHASWLDARVGRPLQPRAEVAAAEGALDPPVAPEVVAFGPPMRHAASRDGDPRRPRRRGPAPTALPRALRRAWSRLASRLPSDRRRHLQAQLDELGRLGPARRAAALRDLLSALHGLAHQLSPAPPRVSDARARRPDAGQAIAADDEAIPSAPRRGLDPGAPPNRLVFAAEAPPSPAVGPTRERSASRRLLTARSGLDSPGRTGSLSRDEAPRVPLASAPRPPDGSPGPSEGGGGPGAPSPLVRRLVERAPTRGRPRPAVDSIVAAARGPARRFDPRAAIPGGADPRGPARAADAPRGPVRPDPVALSPVQRASGQPTESRGDPTALPLSHERAPRSGALPSEPARALAVPSSPRPLARAVARPATPELPEAPVNRRPIIASTPLVTAVERGEIEPDGPSPVARRARPSSVVPRLASRAAAPASPPSGTPSPHRRQRPSSAASPARSPSRASARQPAALSDVVAWPEPRQRPGADQQTAAISARDRQRLRAAFDAVRAAESAFDRALHRAAPPAPTRRRPASARRAPSRARAEGPSTVDRAGRSPVRAILERAILERAPVDGERSGPSAARRGGADMSLERLSTLLPASGLPPAQSPERPPLGAPVERPPGGSGPEELRQPGRSDRASRRGWARGAVDGGRRRLARASSSVPTPLRRPRPTAEPAPPGVAPGVVAGAGRRADDARPPDAHEAVESLLQSLLSRERRLEGAAGELPRASERAARRILEAAQRLSERTRPAAPVRRETLASGTADGGAPRDGGTTLRWSKTYREARRLADELVQLLRSSQARRAPPPAVRRSEEPVAAGDAAAAESRDDKRDRKPDVERALATILRDVTTEIRHRDLTWLSEDPYG